MKVGFIGLGQMGSAMASNLVAGGHTVTVWNRSGEACKPLESLGAKVASTPARAAQGEVLCSMLADDAAVREVVLESGLLDAMDAGTIHVNHATISLALVRELAAAHAARGLEYVAAPVFGRPDAAAAGKLNVVVAGKSPAIEAVRPLLDLMGEKVWPMGESPERANVVKIAGNFMLGVAIESMAEAAALGRAHGVSAADLLNVLTHTMFAVPAYQNYGKLIAESTYTPRIGLTLPLGLKDVGLALTASDEGRTPLPLAGVVRDGLLQALATGDASRDWAALGDAAARRGNLAERGKN